jgi:hypothetical protein
MKAVPVVLRTAVLLFSKNAYKNLKNFGEKDYTVGRIAHRFPCSG